MRDLQHIAFLFSATCKIFFLASGELFRGLPYNGRRNPPGNTKVLLFHIGKMKHLKQQAVLKIPRFQKLLTAGIDLILKFKLCRNTL